MVLWQVGSALAGRVGDDAAGQASSTRQPPDDPLSVPIPDRRPRHRQALLNSHHCRSGACCL